LGRGGAVDRADLGGAELPTPFQAGKFGVLVPLLAGGSLAGVLELGERSSATSYSKLDLNLLDRLARTAGPALQLAHELEIRERNAKEQERAANELDLAKRIQHGLLPSRSPNLEGWTFDAFYQPAREVGGDFYDWIELPDGRLGIVIGDVSDKGIPAALVMATCRALLRSAAGSGLSPGALLADVNDRLEPDIPAAMFVTCLVVFLDPHDGSIEMANAGHNLPFICCAADVHEIMVRGMPLGLMPGMTYEEIATAIPGSGSLVLTSDGLAESHDPDGEMYGTKRLADSLTQNHDDSLATALRNHRDFVGAEWEQEDDMTLVTVHRSQS
jgi:serine phosphatase RsbU (regulator of sigma subunit)